MNGFWLIVSSLVRFLLFGFSLLNDWTGLWYFVDVETETYRDLEIYWISRPRLNETERFLGCRDRDSSRLRNFLDVETETHWDWKISWMSRLRLIETEEFLGCWDRDSSRLENFLDVETETHQDWEIPWMSRPILIETGKFNGCRNRDQSRLGKRCRYRHSIETLAHLWLRSSLDEI